MLVHRPLGCDICRTPFLDGMNFFDAKTKQGPWGYLCQKCFDEHGVGLGTGLGQKYVCGPNNSAWKIEG